jgi:hypothetical protein
MQRRIQQGTCQNDNPSPRLRRGEWSRNSNKGAVARRWPLKRARRSEVQMVRNRAGGCDQSAMGKHRSTDERGGLGGRAGCVSEESGRRGSISETAERQWSQLGARGSGRENSRRAAGDWWGLCPAVAPSQTRDNVGPEAL